MRRSGSYWGIMSLSRSGPEAPVRQPSAEQVQTHVGLTGGGKGDPVRAFRGSPRRRSLGRVWGATQSRGRAVYGNPPTCVALRDTPTSKTDCPSARPPLSGTSPAYLPIPPVLLLTPPNRAIFVALEMIVRVPSLGRNRAVPPYWPFTLHSCLKRRVVGILWGTASHSFVPAACTRKKTKA